MLRTGPVYYYIALFAIFLFISACSESSSGNADNDLTTCEGCHTDQASLQKYALVDDVAPPSGGG